MLAVVAFLSFETVHCQIYQSYVDNQLVGAGLSEAAIVGFDGSVRAKSPNFKPTRAEILGVVRGFSNSAPLCAKISSC